MILFKVKFFDDEIGALGRIIEAISNADVNIQKPCFSANREGLISSRHIGRGTFVVKDEERDTAREKILALAKKRPKLGLDIVGMYYDVTIKLKDEPGALASELIKLAKLGVYICQEQASYKNEKNEVSVNLIFECSPEQYNLAKQALGDKLMDESPFSANAVADIAP